MRRAHQNIGDPADFCFFGSFSQSASSGNSDGSDYGREAIAKQIACWCNSQKQQPDSDPAVSQPENRSENRADDQLGMELRSFLKPAALINML